MGRVRERKDKLNELLNLHHKVEAVRERVRGRERRG